jgi:hypothetical protein
MNMAEILRKLADVVDGQTQGGSETEITNRPGASSEMHTAPEAEGSEDHGVINVKSMVGPLQQKLEMLKRLAGVSSEDEGCEECGCAPCECEPDVVDGADVNHPGAIEISGTMDAEGAQQLADQLAAKEQGQPDELEAMKKMAGIFTAADNDIED